ncbi:S1 family peptidase [Actinomadura parmotrematis]|uniref:Serine protease n=1 Tax=Actinomadura parmotrematis TaxID=2864039 RepID=A0ABS7FRJ7_9ACTN|nr:serine protease [Actinomadura parmotrematis]MBW8482845.1 serine protease [Actinomadura parmotrematis]
MPRRTAAAALAALAAAGAGFALVTAPSQAAPPPVFAGTVALDNCSGALVRGPHAADGDAALVLTNGHCLEGGMPPAGAVVADRPSARAFRLLDAAGTRTVATLRATRLVYATMTGTDVALYRLGVSYGAVRHRYGIAALPLAVRPPSAGTAIRIASGYWRKAYRCRIDGIVHRLREGEWTWSNAIRYGPACATVHGTSGAPIVDEATGEVVGVNNTGNDDGERCTLNNPCEVDERGAVTVRRGVNYGEQTAPLARCLGGDGAVVPGRGCALPAPAR